MAETDPRLDSPHAANARIFRDRAVYATTIFNSDKPLRAVRRAAWVLLVMWLVCYWLYRQKIFIRI